MGEREYEHVQEFRDPNHPDKVLTTHESHTGEEPLYVQSETFVAEGRIESGQVRQQELSHRLDELTNDFYMFSLAPLYLTCLWDDRKNDVKFDLIYRFGVEMKVPVVPQVVRYVSPLPLFQGDAGEWDCLLNGLPKGDSLTKLFPRWVEQLVFVDRERRPMQYWRVNCTTIKITTPTVVSAPASIDVFLPTGVDKCLGVSPNQDGTYRYVQHPPEAWVVEEAMRYFGETHE